MEMSEQENGLPPGWVFVDEPPMVASHDQKPDTTTGLKIAAAGGLMPRAANAAMELATNPNVAKVAGRIGSLVGATAAPVVGAMKGGPLGALAGAAEMGKASWAGSGTGWFTGKTLQRAAMPVAKTLDAMRPYAQILSTLSGIQGALDLNQMAEPNRRDIGFLGIGAQTPEEAAKEGERLNAITQQTNRLPSISELNADTAQMRDLVRQGLSPMAAAQKLSGGSAVKFHALVSLYSPQGR